MRTRVKICCIANPEEARIAISSGADALGLVGAMPSGPGIITDEMAREIANSIPPPVSTFLLTAETSARGINDHVQFVGADTVQIVKHVDPAEHEKLKTMIPDVRRVQVIHVESEQSLALIQNYEPFIDAFLLDSGMPTASTPQLGGTGRTHDWSISRQFVINSEKPVFLAGGLKPENITDAISCVSPFGVDLCSGVRKNGKLDEALLKDFMKAVVQSDRLAQA